MSGPDSVRPRLLSRGFWAMMALAAASFLAAAALTTFAVRHRAAAPSAPPRGAPLAAEARGAKRTTPDPSLGPP